MFWLLVAAIVFALIVLWYRPVNKEKNKLEQLASKLAGPPPLPIIGNALEYGTNSQDFLKNLMRIAEQYGEVTANWIGPVLYVLAHTAEDMEIILSSKTLIDKAVIYQYVKPWLGSGLISAEGEKWRRNRKLLTPAFHFKILENYIPVFERNVKILVEKLEAEVDREEFNVENYIDKSTLDIICETAMATEMNSQKKDLEFQKALKKASFAVLYRAFKPWLHPDFIFNWSLTGSLFYKNVSIIQDFIGKVITKRKEEFNAQNEEKIKEYNPASSDIYFGYKSKKVFLDMLLELSSKSNSHLTDLEIRDEVNTFMFAGHDTTTSAICFALYLLSRHPDVQDKIIEEIRDVYGDLDDSPISYNDVMGMKYLERVIKETLRLYPSVPYIGRILNEDVTLSKGDVAPKGCNLVCLFYKLHRDPKVFPNPEEFNPDNFLPEKLIGRHPFAYCPFSAGPRNCIGQKFAMLEIKATILFILRKYCLLPGKTDIKIASELILRSSSGVHIAIKKRNQ